MKKIVESKPADEVTVEEICNKDNYLLRKILFAYKSEGKSGWCFLTKIECGKYGFVAMNYTDTNPRFVGKSMQEAIQLAVKCREVFAFNGVEELVYTITNNK